MNETLMPFFWVAITFPILLLLQRWIHRHLRGVALLVTGRADWSVLVYAIILFPGVLLHELSHWITANILGVRTSTFSLTPQMKSDGSVQLGYVEYYKGRTLGPIRESLIGGAPLIFGTIVILLIGLRVFGVTDLGLAIQSGEIDNLTGALGGVFSAPDFLVWLYLLFAISNAMMPSKSDRRAWPAFLGLLAVVGLIVFVLDLQAALWAEIAGPAATIFGYLGLAFSLAIGVDIVFILLISAIEWILSRVKGVEVIYEDVEAAPSS